MAAIYVVIYLSCADDDKPHWCLYTIDDSGNELIFEALGSSGVTFRYNSRPVDMDKSLSEKQRVKIGRIEADVWPDIPSLFARVPMSSEVGWNCQNWVMQAISALKGENYLEEDERGVAYVQGKYQKKKEEF
ncbi:hypothetical protein P154DRAFT_567864 [Amniculicola lignicola CBS 123094]|uniref:Uncharacterized protein n=1 Tax=Amniculicola lignicola CBS 123094 TaxID=1392246 RepID=A0A6A5VXS0_9PLEO|nr:hypothetical protein P154DRAFT_567864 [Amniculicola lignicola CBS 123094]